LPTNWQYKDRFPYFKNRLYIPANDVLKTKIAKGCHDSKGAGHFGMEKTIEIIMRDFYWKGLTEWINDYVRSSSAKDYPASDTAPLRPDPRDVESASPASCAS